MSTSLNRAARRTLQFAADGTASVMAAAATFPASLGLMGTWEKRMWMAFFGLAAFNNQAMAQGAGSNTVTQLNNVKTTVIGIGQVLFAIFLMVALVKTVKKFLSGEPDAMTSLLWLVGGILLFFGFQVLKNQLVSNAGGLSGGGVE
jgi:mannose/fructose/N-acetylgalactosamine-specific phosphotransferase system component IIC